MNLNYEIMKGKSRRYIKKLGKRLISHRSTAYPCFLPDLGEFGGSWSYETCPGIAKIEILILNTNLLLKNYKNSIFAMIIKTYKS